MDELIDLAMQATWSLEEAAHLVHQINPVTQPVELSDRSTHPVAGTYFWLKKEYEKGHLYFNSGNEETPRFSPGTLMRHLEEKGRPVSKVIRNMYDSHNGHHGLEGLAPLSKQVYLDAAELIWSDQPGLSATQVANTLVALRTKYTKSQLILYKPSTFRKWLRGKGPGKVGRPSSQKKTPVQVDLTKIVEKLGGN